MSSIEPAAGFSRVMAKLPLICEELLGVKSGVKTRRESASPIPTPSSTTEIITAVPSDVGADGEACRTVDCRHPSIAFLIKLVSTCCT
jgi:hypothetical protein